MKNKIITLATIVLIFNNVCHAQWKAIGPFGGLVWCLAIQNNSVLAGTETGIYKSDDNGANWTPFNFGMPIQRIYTVFSFGDVLFAGTVKGLYINKGSGWEKNVYIPDLPVRAFTKFGKSLFAATDKGAYISGDDGEIWVAINKGIDKGPFPALGYSLAATSTNLFLSTDAGMCIFNPSDSSWIMIKNGLPTISFGGPVQIPLGNLVVKDNTVFGTNLWGVFSYNKSENEWERKINGMTDTMVKCIAVKDNAIYVGTWNGNVFVSTDNTENWTLPKNTGLIKGEINAIIVKDKFIFSGINGVYISNDNASSWKESNKGMSQLTASGLVITDTSISAVGTTIFKTIDNGQKWIQTRTGLSKTYNYFTSIVKHNNTLFAGNEVDGIYRSLNNGNSWVAYNAGLTKKNISCLHSYNSKLYAGTKGGGVFELNGSNWLSILKDLPNKNVNALLISDTTMIVSTDSGACFYEKNGTNWVLKNLKLQGYKINFVLADSNYLITATDSGIFVSINNGSNWLSSNTGLTNLNTHTLLTYDNKVFVGTENGVFMSNDSAKTWAEINGGLPQYITVNTLQVSGKTIYAGTNNGVWNLPISDLKGSVEKVSKLSLKTYPNPVNNYLYFSNETAKIKRVTIYDCQGKLLIQQNLNEDRINLEQLKLGLYFLRAFDSNENTYTAKFLKD